MEENKVHGIIENNKRVLQKIPESEREKCTIYKLYRLRLGLKQSDVANLAGISQAFYSQIERGDNYGTPESIRAVARALGIRPLVDASELIITASQPINVYEARREEAGQHYLQAPN